MAYTRLNPEPRIIRLENGSLISDNANGNVFIATPLVNGKWANYSFEKTGIWMRVYSGSGTDHPDGNWKLIASWS